MIAGFALLAFVTLQRLAELALARHNTRALLARGAVEVAPGHYPLIVGLHGAWLAGLWLLAPERPLQPFPAALYLVLQPFRAWVLMSLGERWTTRILVLPGAPLVRAGPYRFLSHPNYVIVGAEIALLPIAFGLVAYAIVFTVLNAVVLTIRIRAETQALAAQAGPPP